MRHHPVASEEAAIAISEAIWRICLAAGSSATTSRAVGWRRTLDGWMIDLLEDFNLKILNPAAANDLMPLISPAITTEELASLANQIQSFAGQSVRLTDLLPPSVASGLIDTSNLRLPARIPPE